MEHQLYDNCPLPPQIVRMYDDAGLPLAVLDQEFYLVWHNQHARRTLPGLAALNRLDITLADIPGTDALKNKLSENNHLYVFAGPGSPFCGRRFLLFAAPADCGAYYLIQPCASEEDAHMENISASFESNIRQSISSIFSALQPLADRAVSESPDGNALPYLRRIGQESMQLLRGCNLIVDYTRMANGLYTPHPVQAELTDFLRSCFQALADMTERIGVPLSYRLPDQMLLAAFDKKLLVNILSHLVSNACRFTRIGNRIDITVYAEEAGACITVSDRAAGIPPEAAPHIFEPYYSYSPDGAPFLGNGLGLAVAWEAAALMGGSLTFTSAAGSGSSFRLRIPLEAPPGERPSSLSLESYTPDGYLENPFSVPHIAMADCLPFRFRNEDHPPE